MQNIFRKIIIRKLQNSCEIAQFLTANISGYTVTKKPIPRGKKSIGFFVDTKSLSVWIELLDLQGLQKSDCNPNQSVEKQLHVDEAKRNVHVQHGTVLMRNLLRNNITEIFRLFKFLV